CVVVFASSPHCGQKVAVNGLNRKPLGPIKDFNQLELLPGVCLLGVGVNRVPGSASPVNGGQVPAVTCLNALVLRSRWITLRQPEFLPTRRAETPNLVSSDNEILRPIPRRLRPNGFCRDIVPVDDVNCEFAR